MNGRLINRVTGEVFELVENCAIGRSSQSLVPIADPRVSRRHALIRWQDDGFWFFDLGSSNGSYLNRMRVTTAQRLNNSDVITIGDHELVFDGHAPSAGGQAPPVTEQTIVEVRPRDAIILVGDIQGYTVLSERLEPAHLAPIIGTWYGEIERILTTHGATLDKFIGDCVLAYWLDTSHETRLAALRTANAMQKVCDQVQNTHHQILDEVGLTFHTGAALHLGPTAHGAFTSGAFTLLGDAVNLAFRLEALTRELDKQVLVSGDFLNSWEDGNAFCHPCGLHNVKGRTVPVEVFSLESSPA